MTREEAFTILGLPSNSGEEQIKRKYGESYNDYQIRLTQAPTPNLKKLYQKNLQELNDAMEILVQGSSTGMVKDLPGSAPVFDQSFGAPSAPTQSFQHSGMKKETPKAAKKAAETDGKFKKWFKITLVAGVLFLSVGALATIQWLEAKKNVDALTADLASKDAVLKAAATEMDYFKKNYENGVFKIKNFGSSPLTVKWVIVTYRNPKGELVKFQQMLNLVINPGSEKKLEYVEGSETIWDGSVSSYACDIEYAGGIMHQAGVWSQDIRDGYLKLSL